MNILLRFETIPSGSVQVTISELEMLLSSKKII